MRYAIFGDIHGNWHALDAVLKAYASENIDLYLCTGDLVGWISRGPFRGIGTNKNDASDAARRGRRGRPKARPNRSDAAKAWLRSKAPGS